ncbi:MAG: 1-acyl-sn-glycerol-3-phosphate acyltransferase [Nanoarchaeota archaeon]|nr:1-acyl-sn-glycerol-3-phosphate acyltransferase [Nanoarchaeota archaeon]
MKINLKENNYWRPSPFMYDISMFILVNKEILKKKVKVENLEKIPEKAPLLVVGNHTNYIDPAYLAYVFHNHAKKSIHLNFMMLDDLLGKDSWKSKIINKLANIFNGYPVDRDRITRAQHNFFRNILMDDYLAIFFGGRRSRDGTFNYMYKKDRSAEGIVHLVEVAQKEINLKKEENKTLVNILPFAMTYDIFGDVTITFDNYLTFNPKELNGVELKKERKKFVEDIINNNVGYNVKVNLDALFADYLVRYANQYDDEKSAKLVLNQEKFRKDLYSMVNILNKNSRINLDVDLLNKPYFSDMFNRVFEYFDAKQGVIEKINREDYILYKKWIIREPCMGEQKTKEEQEKMGKKELKEYKRQIRKIDKNTIYHRNKIIHLEEVSEAYEKVNEQNKRLTPA